MTDLQSGLRRVFYVSLAAVDAAQLETLVESSRRNNARDDITGVLLYTGGAFAQIIEGPSGAMESLVQRLRDDTRHHGMRILLDEPPAHRLTQGWTMHLLRDEGADDLLRLLVQEPELADGRARNVLDHLLQAVRPAGA